MGRSRLPDAPDAPDAAQGAAPCERLRRRRDFEALTRGRAAARPVRHRLLTLRSRPNGLEQCRVGFAVGRPVGGAVVRNRVKRRLREIVRALPLAAGNDIVIAARPASRGASFEELHDALASCARRAGLAGQATGGGR
ncbi:MAG: ribonuclease P protein component [Chloroflexi bacterium]|nr:ribonuclease P protein component [Chloroflexota bacterium]